jgi:hypothetical protein
MDPFNQELLILLRQRRDIDLAIAKLVGESRNGVRFSEKKFVGDLGEFYFFQNRPPFLELTQSVTSNDEFDFRGKLSAEGADVLKVPEGHVRIEVKTRHAQRGNNHLFGLHPEKFDLLAFVALADDFSCRYIGLLRSADITADHQNRIRFSDYHKKGLVRWETNEWTELQ